MAKILLVEDDNNLREIYEARLQAEGYDITSAQDGEQALVVAKEQKPDLIISDVMMPKISGFEMLDILRNTEGMKETKVIMLTALGQAEDRDRAGSLGADRYLVKSQVTLEDIVKAAHELLEPASQTPTTEQTAAAALEPPTTVAPAVPTPQISVAVSPSEPVLSPEPPQVQPVEPTPVTPEAPSVTSPVTTSAIAPDPNTSAPTTPSVPTPAPNVKTVDTPTASAQMPTTEATSVPELKTPDLSSPANTPETTPDNTSSNRLTSSQIDMPKRDTTAEEEATVEDQIEDFIKNIPPDASGTVKPTSTPSETEQSASEAATESNDNIMQESVDSLIASTEQEKPAVTPVSKAPAIDAVSPVKLVKPAMLPAEQSEVTTKDDSSDAVTITHKKMLQPITNLNPRPDLNELMAREEAKNIVNSTPVVGGDTSASDTSSAAGPAKPTVGYSENVVKPAQSNNDDTPASKEAGVPPAQKDYLDPNNIAL